MSTSVYNAVYASGIDQVAWTPSGLLALLKQRYLPDDMTHFFNPCPPRFSGGRARAKPCSTRGVSGTSSPRGQILERAVAQQDECFSVVLLPCRFSTLYFQKHVRHAIDLVYLNCRIKVAEYRTRLHNPLCVVAFGPETWLKPSSTTTVNVSFYAFDSPRVNFAEVLDTLDDTREKTAINCELTKTMPETLQKHDRLYLRASRHAGGQKRLHYETGPSMDLRQSEPLPERQVPRVQPFQHWQRPRFGRRDQALSGRVSNAHASFRAAQHEQRRRVPGSAPRVAVRKRQFHNLC